MPAGNDTLSDDLSAAGARPSLGTERPLRLLVCGAGGGGEGTLALLSLTPSEEISDRPPDPDVPDGAYRPVLLDGRRFLVAEWPDARPDGPSVAVAAIADAAILVVDADAGPNERVHRHAAILSLLALPKFVLAARSGEPVDARGALLSRIVEAVEAGPDKANATSAEGSSPAAADQFSAKILWLGAAPMVPGRDYVLRAGQGAVPMTVSTLRYRLDPGSGARESAAMLAKGELGVCNLSLRSPLALHPFASGPAEGCFVLCERMPDDTSGETLGIGTIRFALRRATNIQWQALDVTKAARAAAKGQKPVVLWLTGLSGSGKSTIANTIEKRLHHLGRHTYLLDGDNVRHGLNRDLGFTEADRVENIRRVAEVARLFAEAGLIVLVSFISPYRSERRMARELMPAGEFVEIFVDTPVAECARRDPKGLYARAKRGEIKNFTGIDSPYEPPLDPDLRLATLGATPEDLAAVVEEHLRKAGVID